MLTCCHWLVGDFGSWSGNTMALVIEIDDNGLFGLFVVYEKSRHCIR